MDLKFDNQEIRAENRNTDEKFLPKTTAKKLKVKKDEIGDENDIIRVKGCRILSKSKTLKVRINEEIINLFIS